jgi:hypothetical protein
MEQLLHKNETINSYVYGINIVTPFTTPLVVNWIEQFMLIYATVSTTHVELLFSICITD